MNSKIKIRIETVNPKKGEEYLSTSLGNRPSSVSNLYAMVRDFKNGTFVQNCDPIRFKEGHLVDGHHRLRALILAGVSFEFLIAEDVGNPDLIDSGLSRRLSDVLSVNGVQYYRGVAAACNYLSCYRRHGVFRSDIKLRPNRNEGLETLRDNPLIVTFVAEYAAKKSAIPIPASVLGVIHLLLAEVDDEKADIYMNQISIGAQLNSGDAAHTFRKWIISRVSGVARGRISAPDLGKYLIYCWNKYITRTPLYVINKIQGYPPIFGLDGKPFKVSGR